MRKTEVTKNNRCRFCAPQSFFTQNETEQFVARHSFAHTVAILRKTKAAAIGVAGLHLTFAHNAWILRKNKLRQMGQYGIMSELGKHERKIRLHS